MKKILLFVSVVLIVGLGVVAFADKDESDNHGRSVRVIVEEIRNQQNLNKNQSIDPDKLDKKVLEELGDAVMDVMIQDSRQHRYMDEMMGGEGSDSLAAMHEMMGYHYLDGANGGSGMIHGTPGFGMGMMMPMMGGWSGNSWGRMDGNNNMLGGRRNYGNWRGGWKNMNYGMMMPYGMGFGGGLMMIVFILLIVGVIYIFTKNTKTGRAETDTPQVILKKRYAKGEISKEELTEKLKIIS